MITKNFKIKFLSLDIIIHSSLNIIISFFFFQPVHSQINIFNSTPDWESQPLGQYATGLGIADINNDGWDDIVVANGNDKAKQRLYVYYNNGNGTFPTAPSWTSTDTSYHGHLSVGDINGDGYPDVAVSSFLGPGRFSDPGYIKVYYNQGDTLESLPSYRSADSMYNFSCALGDADGDGDLDLAVACGEPYSGITDYGRIYFNHNGILDSLPGWSSSIPMGALDVDFADMDNNGYLDLIFACHLTPNYIYLADSTGLIQEQPTWQSQDINSHYANSLTVTKVDDNNYLDLIVSDNSQLGGLGKFKAYIFSSRPFFQSSPSWYSNSGGYGSAVLAEDLNQDSHPDLIAGRWWGNVQIYLGNGNSFNTTPDWQSASSSVIEAYALRDLDQDGQAVVQDNLSISKDSLHVIYLSQQSVENILSVNVNNQPLLAGTDFCTLPGGQWISTKLALVFGDQVVVDYTISHDRDLIVTNWGINEGNYIFYNTTPTSIARYQPENGNTKIAIFPNPFNARCNFECLVHQNTEMNLNIYDISGRLIKNIFQGKVNPGKKVFSWDGKNKWGNTVASGMYFYRFDIDRKSEIGKLLLLK